MTMLNRIVFFRSQIFVLLCMAAFLIGGCASKTMNHKEFKASIEENQTWKMTEKCADEDCTMNVDFLTGKTMTVRVELDNDAQTKKFFIIRMEFTAVRNQGIYKPAAVALRLDDKETLKPKVFSCYYTIADLNYLRERPSLEGSFPVNKLDCYLLFFDHPALSAGNNAVLHLDNALMVNNKRMEIPPITFKKYSSMP